MSGVAGAPCAPARARPRALCFPCRWKPGVRAGGRVSAGSPLSPLAPSVRAVCRGCSDGAVRSWSWHGCLACCQVHQRVLTCRQPLAQNSLGAWRRGRACDQCVCALRLLPRACLTPGPFSACPRCDPESCISLFSCKHTFAWLPGAARPCPPVLLDVLLALTGLCSIAERDNCLHGAAGRSAGGNDVAQAVQAAQASLYPALHLAWFAQMRLRPPLCCCRDLTWKSCVHAHASDAMHAATNVGTFIPAVEHPRLSCRCPCRRSGA